jgi:hypothetical protein
MEYRVWSRIELKEGNRDCLYHHSSFIPSLIPHGKNTADMLTIQANESRSYDITIDLGVDRPGAQVKPNPLLRKGEYNLSQQCFK